MVLDSLQLHARLVTFPVVGILSMAVGMAIPTLFSSNVGTADEVARILSRDSVTEFDIANGESCNTVRSGACELAGTLNIQFSGPIMPHENTQVELYGEGVDSISGKFDLVHVPDGWLYDLEYDFDKPADVVKNFRPDRPPAFPGAEGFGKYAIGGRAGQVIQVTNLNDDGLGSFRAACEAEGPRIVVFKVSGTIAIFVDFC